MQDLRVAIVQTVQYWEDKKKNLSHYEKRFENEINEEIDLILLPEMFNTGFTMNVASMAEKMNGISVEWLVQMAKKKDCAIGATLIIEEDQNYYNRFIIVSEQGVLHQYDKRHLFRMAKENDFFTQGTERKVICYKGWNILLQVCYDLRFPVFSRNKTMGEEREYDLAIYLANWPEKRNSVWKVLLQARAIENQAYVIGVNRVGTDGNNINYSGDSMCVDPWGAIENQLAENEEVVKILTLKTQTLTNITKYFPAFKDAD